MAQAVTTTEVFQPFTISDANADAAVLRAQIAEQGYLFFRGLVPIDVVMQVRRAVLELCAADGWLDPTRELMDAVVAPGVQPTTEGKPEYAAVYRKVLKHPDFHNFPAHPSLMGVAAKLLGDDVLVHPRRIGRMTFPHNTVATTPPHQDYYYIRGTVDTYSCWTPLGECPSWLGGLAIWPGSHKNGYIDHTVHSPGAVGGCGVEVDPAKAVWHSIDFEPGDALFFTSYTIHKALPNMSDDRLRVSTDNRYQRPNEAIEPSALKPHLGLDLGQN